MINTQNKFVRPTKTHLKPLVSTKLSKTQKQANNLVVYSLDAITKTQKYCSFLIANKYKKTIATTCVIVKPFLFFFST